MLRNLGRHRDFSLLGVALDGSALALGCAMRSFGHAHIGMFAHILCFVLFSAFAHLAWLIPIIMGVIGLILVCGESDMTVIAPMTFSGLCYVVLFATLLHVGMLGRTIAHVMSLVFGDFAQAITAGLTGLLTFSMTGISVRRTALDAWSILWDIRVPAHLFCLPQRSEEAVPPPIALPAVASVVEEAIEAEFVDTDSAQPSVIYEEKSHINDYHFPELGLFCKPIPQKIVENREQLIIDTLASFRVKVSVANKVIGPSITRYELSPGKGVSVDKISNRADDLALALAAKSIRIEAPIPGKSLVGLEVPNAKPATVTIREILEAMPTSRDMALPMALGKDITGTPVFADLADMPHLLVAGATGSGKSVCLNNIITSLLVSCTPDLVQMLFIDPKRVELSVYNGIPHLMRPVITDPKQAAGALSQIEKTMDERLALFAACRVRNIDEYNAHNMPEKLPYIVVVIDELADLMLIARDTVETVINRLAAVARAAGIHLIVATQRPSVNVITGVIKANIPSRIAFAVSSQIDSRVILDEGGAELLLGRGDMLFRSIDAMKAKRIQGALVTGAEVGRLVDFWTPQASPENRVEVDTAMLESAEEAVDPMMIEAARFVVDLGQASTARLQARFSVGHPKALRLMKSLEEMAVIGPHEGTKSRRVLMTSDELEASLERKAVTC